MRTFSIPRTVHLFCLLALIPSAGCGKDSEDSASATSSDGTSADGTEGTGGDGTAADGADGTDGTDGTGGDNLTVAAAVEDHPLIAWVTVEAPAAGTISMVATAAGAPDRVLPAFPLEADSPTTVPFVGLRAETTYALQVTHSDGAVTETSVTTGALPEDLPPVNVEVLDADRVNPGFVVFSLARWNNMPSLDWGYVAALDEGGAFCWFTETRFTSTFRWRDTGSMLITDITQTALEIDLLGQPLQALDVESAGLSSIHHELAVVPGEGEEDRLLFLSSDLREIDGYADPETGETVSHNVVSDVLAESTWSGSVGRTVNLFDLLDPMRTSADFHSAFWNMPPYSTVSEPKDWTHGNAMLEDAGGNWLVSLRNQDWLVKVDPDERALVWTLGFEGDFELLSGRWFSTQHSPSWLDEETLLLYDNGARRPDEVNPSTRVVAYRVDEDARTIEELWEYTGEAPYFVPAGGGVEPVEDGFFISDGSVVDAVSVVDGVLVPHLTARFVEVEGSAGSFEPVFRVTVGHWGERGQPSYLSYRGAKVEDLYGSRGVLAYAR